MYYVWADVVYGCDLCYVVEDVSGGFPFDLISEEV